MTKSYRPDQIEPKWQSKWEAAKIYQFDEKSDKEKYYCMDMFPYPSGAGLHVGHLEGYTATDVLSRYMRAQGKNVMHPIGWDAFGLPAENYALKEKKHPEVTTQAAIKRFISQMKRAGLSYDWTREINTSSPDYYRWTQWLFLEFYKHNLAYRKAAPVNWCPSCQTVLANEQVIKSDEKNVCERCGTEVEHKNLEQWFYRITKYADALIDDLDSVDWPTSTKQAQRNWIGRSEGAEIEFKISGTDEVIKVFTTRPDTLFGATYMVLAPEHPLVNKIILNKSKKVIDAYVKKAIAKSEVQRSAQVRDKTGVFTGTYAINPLNQEKIPVWVADYVLMGYGTGAIMAVPAHDERDLEFAKKFKLPIINVIDKNGIMENSGKYDGMDAKKCQKAIVEELGDKKSGKTCVNYKLRDWLVSRQRYWGPPIPIIYCPHCANFIETGRCCGANCGCNHENCSQSDDKVMLTKIRGKSYALIPVPTEDLPVKLTYDVDFKPTGESPLFHSKDFHNVSCPRCGAKEGVRRESDTLDTFVDSSWYFLRFCDPNNNKEFASKKLMKRLCPVDFYGGADHATTHLIFARFFTKVLKDLGYIDFKEPFSKFKFWGTVLGEDSSKMSKRKGNVINPEEMCDAFGADSLRSYEMFMGPVEQSKAWSTRGLEGVKRFYNRVWELTNYAIDNNVEKSSDEARRWVHKVVKKVGEDIEEVKFNTAIAYMMEFTNFWQKNKDSVSKDLVKMFVQVMAPFAPHMAEELWEMLGEKFSVTVAPWPRYDPALVKDSLITVVVQINGKVRDRVDLSSDEIGDEVLVRSRVLNADKVREIIEGKEIKGFIYKEGKIVSIVL